MLTKTQVRAILDKMEVLPEGHFALPDGRHAPQGLFPMRVLQAPEYAQSLATTLASVYRTQTRPQVIVAGPGPSALLGLELARACNARLVYCEVQDGRLCVSPGQALLAGERVVICENIVADPAALVSRVELVKASGAELQGVAALFDLTTGDFPWSLEALLRPEIVASPAAHCPQCAAGQALSATGTCMVA